MTTVNATLPVGWWRDGRKRAEVEAQVEALLDDGLTYGRIAAKVGTSTRFVEDYVRRRWGAARRVQPRGQVQPGQRLTARELQVVARMVDSDEPTPERAARDLGITVRSVFRHIEHVCTKLGVRSLLHAYRVLVVEQDRRLPNWRVAS